ncbi:MAG: recombinase family protein [Lachnospiraceae bacterium]
MDRGDKAESIDSQLAIMEAFVKKDSNLIIIDNYVDCGKSGTDFNRPEYQRMLADAKGRKIDCIIVKDLSRLGRNQLEVSKLIQIMLPFLQVRFISVNDHFDTEAASNDNKLLEIDIKNTVNDMYAKDISKRIASARKMSMEKGSFVGSFAPYGYQIETIKGIRTMVVDEATAPIVVRVFDLALNGMPLRKIAEILNTEKITIPGQYQKTKHLYIEPGDEAKQWHIGTLSNILHNKAYIGSVVQNKSNKKLYANMPEKQNKEEDYIVLEDFHEVIIDKDIFDQVQKLNEKKIAKSTFNSNRGKSVRVQENKYQGLFYCGICGKPMPQLSELVENGGSKLTRKYYYYCRGQAGNVEEHIGGIRIVETLLDEIVMNAIQKQVKDFVKDKKPTIQVVEKQAKKKRSSCEKSLKLINIKLAELDYEESELYSKRALVDITNDEYLDALAELQKKQFFLKSKLKLIEEKIAKIDKMEASLIQITKTFLRCNKIQKVTKELLLLLVQRIELHPGKELVIAFTFEDEFKGVEEFIK